MRTLYVLYDPRCELCRRLKDWLQLQRCWLELRLMPANSDETRALFPGLEQIASSSDLVVISDEGEAYLNNHAWIMALYALTEYRDWACRLAHPLLLPFARQAFDAISRNRHAISRWLEDASSENIAEELRNLRLEPCLLPEGTISDYLQ